MSTTDRSRRHFLQTAVAGGVALAARNWWSPCAASQPAARARDELRIAVIGTGVRGKYLIGNLPASARVVALCDCATSRMASTLEPQGLFVPVLARFKDAHAAGCKTYQDYRRMLDGERLDAAIIATPDHHHVPAAIRALHAGLDVYLEKPLTITIREGRLLADLVRQTGRVLQVGSQQRTMEINCFACQFIRDGGLGTISRVELPNYPGPIAEPDLPEQPVPQGLDWDLFCGPAPLRTHHHKLWVKDEFKVGDLLWRGWDLYRDYSGHMMTNWGGHSVDMVQYALGQDRSGPVEIEAIRPDQWTQRVGEPVAGGSASLLSLRAIGESWSDKTPLPDSLLQRRFWPVRMRYTNGVELHFVLGQDAIWFYGQRGTMRMRRNEFTTDPEELVTNGPDPSVADKWLGEGHVARPHLENWIECIQTRGVPNAPVEIGHRTATICHLANIAREVNRPLKWDPAAEQFEGDEAANQRLDRPRRKGFELPI